jgi:hypothetical protein
MSKQLIEPPFGLKERILKKIRQEQRLAIIKTRIVIFSVGLISSIFAFIPALNLLINELNRSGFTKFFSLISSDLSFVAEYWQIFSLSLLESLPVVGLIAFFGVIFVLLVSLKNLSKGIVEIKLQKV